MNTVKVMFRDPKYNYITSLSARSTKADAEDYFVNQPFNVGDYPRDDYQVCVGIEYNANYEVA